ncbi:hypothetical protein [Chitinophaga sp. HK235]|uniref:hypothetical protein n=1 Tax=Chitinophaga sp. HK235 TaxID=2952571 RepID=UPI001BA87CB2|nr:hypothetical protein [Chitinophaga sp. HK235]
MKHVLKATLLVAFLAACQGKEKIVPQPDPIDNPPVDTGMVVPVGVADGDPVTRVIGPTGGTIATGDGRITVVIPAGALAAETGFTVQPITNTNKAGLGKAFRITPHQVLTKPATITFQYEDADLANTFAEALGIAYQDNSGKWKAVGGIQLNKTNKTVTVKTTHFSDWSFFEAIFLEPANAFLDLGQSMPLAVKSYFNASMNDLLYPLTQEGVEHYIGNPKNDVSAEYIDGWALAGAGNLSSNGGHAAYQAPATMPASNPAVVTVRVKLKNGALGLILANMFVAQEGIAYRIDGGQWELLPAASGHSGNGVSGIGATPGEGSFPSCNLTWLGAPEGRRPWSETTYFTLQKSPEHLFLAYYQVGQTSRPSPGYFHAVSVGGVGGDITGTFRLDKASSQKKVGDHTVYAEHKIDGIFKVKRLI